MNAHEIVLLFIGAGLGWILESLIVLFVLRVKRLI